MSILKKPPPLIVERILRPQTGIDLTMEVDDLTGQADIRSTMIVGLDPERVIVAQTEPPLMKSRLRQKLGASVVRRNPVTREILRLGWTTTVLGFRDAYKLNPDKKSADETVPAIVLDRPSLEEMTKSNIRQAYRLTIDRDSDITLTLNPKPAAFHLANFSASGLMLSTTTPSAFTLGLKLSFKLTFPAGADLPVHRIEGKAVVVRLEMDPKTRKASLGLKFQELSSEARRALPKIIHYYMLEEQRGRNPDERRNPLDEL